MGRLAKKRRTLNTGGREEKKMDNPGAVFRKEITGEKKRG